MTWIHVAKWTMSIGALYVLMSILFPCKRCRNSCPLVLSDSVYGITSTWNAGENRDNLGTSSSAPVVIKRHKLRQHPQQSTAASRGTEFELLPE